MQTFSVTNLPKLELLNVTVEPVTYRDRPAMRLLETDPTSDQECLAILPDSKFKDGEIETMIAGSPRPDAPADMRGFVGIAFRVQPQASQFEVFYLRPTNGRANDQLRRNHSTQYSSHPDFPWFKLREENPGVYESYVDLVPGEWTQVKIVASGTRAELYVNAAEQPCLIVNDLKLGQTEGNIGLWIGAGSQAYFSDISVSPE